MTLVSIEVKVPEIAGLGPASGALRWTPTKRHLAGDSVVMPKGFTAELVNGEAAIEVEPSTAEWAWRVDEAIPGTQSQSRFVAVPDLAQVDYTTLIQVDPATLVPSAEPEPAWYAYVDTLTGQATTASASAIAAKVAAEAAEASATGSQTSAAASAATATTKASEASTSATNAAGSATTALGHKNDAAASAGAAASSATAAANSQAGVTASANAAAASDTHATSMSVIAQSSASDSIAAANGFSIGTVTTGSPGDAATATITGSAPNKLLNLGLPKGNTGPANSLSVLETTTGPETPGATGPQGIQGIQGVPGGFTAGTDLATSDLNTITTPGLYRQADTTKATLVSNYPVAGANGAGTLMVVQQGGSASAGIEQIWYGNWTTAGGRVFYIRNYYNASIWTPWRAFNSTRVDQTAGRAIYQWDDLNNREQLTYGDTGWRTLTPANGWTGTSLLLRRVGQQVSVVALNINGSAATSDAVTEVLPSGFRATNLPVSVRVPVLTGTTTDATRAAAIDISLHTLRVLGAAYTGLASGQIFTTYPTSDNWPTTLPGTANGTIPNL